MRRCINPVVPLRMATANRSTGRMLSLFGVTSGKTKTSAWSSGMMHRKVVFRVNRSAQQPFSWQQVFPEAFST
jgi:hypothetical protein